MRRLTGSGLIVLMLAAPALQAAGGSAGAKVRLELLSPSPGQVEALCQAVRQAGAQVRAEPAGGAICLEVSAASPSALAEALAALRRSAGSVGLKTRTRAPAPDAPRFLAPRAGDAGQFRWHPAFGAGAVRPARPLQPDPLVCTGTAWVPPPASGTWRVPCGESPRAPPA
jgi:hypothetical protein